MDLFLSKSDVNKMWEVFSQNLPINSIHKEIKKSKKILERLEFFKLIGVVLNEKYDKEIYRLQGYIEGLEFQLNPED